MTSPPSLSLFSVTCDDPAPDCVVVHHLHLQRLRGSDDDEDHPGGDPHRGQEVFIAVAEGDQVIHSRLANQKYWSELTTQKQAV